MEFRNLKKAFINVAFWGPVLWLAVAGSIDIGKNVQRAGQSARNAMDAKTMRAAGEQWLADPEHGWIRDEKRAEAPNKHVSSQNPSENSGGKTSGILWEH